MKLLLICAFAALCVFAQVARAQEEDVEPAAPAPVEKNEEASLESRGSGAYGRGNGRENSRGRYLEGGRGRSQSGRGRRGGRGASRGSNGAGLGREAGAGGLIQNIGVTNKVVQGYTEVLPTVETESRERHDFKSQSDSFYRQNSASTVTQKNKRKQTFIHTHLNQVYYHPLHVTHILKHHHTTFVKELFPEKKIIKIYQKQKIYEPEKATIIKYTQDSSFKNYVAPTKVENAERKEQLQTIREPVKNLGVRNIGSPLDAIRAGESFSGFESGNRRVESGNGGYLRGESNSRGGYGEKNSYLAKRTGDVKEETEAIKTEIAPEVKPETVAEKKE